MAKAIRIHAFGDPSVLQYEDLPALSPKSGEALVKIDAIGVNYLDIYHRNGIYPITLPVTLGQEFSGYATQVRQGAARVRDALPRLGQIPLGGTATGVLHQHDGRHAEFLDGTGAELGRQHAQSIRQSNPGLQALHVVGARTAISARWFSRRTRESAWAVNRNSSRYSVEKALTVVHSTAAPPTGAPHEFSTRATRAGSNWIVSPEAIRTR